MIWGISLESFRSFRGSLFCKPVIGQDLFYGLVWHNPKMFSWLLMKVQIVFEILFFSFKEILLEEWFPLISRLYNDEIFKQHSFFLWIKQPLIYFQIFAQNWIKSWASHIKVSWHTKQGFSNQTAIFIRTLGLAARHWFQSG